MNSTQIVNEKITNIILAKLAAGVIPWRKPWACKGAAGCPRNFITGKAYRGVNVWLLDGYETPFWLTFNQARALKAKVRKGEKATAVVFWSILKKKVKDANNVEKEKKIFFLRYYYVFNVEQCEGIKPEKIDALKRKVGIVKADDAKPFDSVAAAQAIIDQYQADDGIKIKFGGDRAFYSCQQDFIQLPKREDFTTPANYYHTAFHECIHSTGAEKRLNREGIAKFDQFGSEQYAKEELIAEFGATFLAAQCEIEVPLLENAAAYIKHWSAKIKEDPKLIVAGASAAQRAVDYITTAHPADDDATVPEDAEIEGVTA